MRTNNDLASEPLKFEISVLVLSDGHSAGGEKQENTKGWPAAESGAEWLKQQVWSIRRRGAGGEKQENHGRPSFDTCLYGLAEEAGVADPGTWCRCGNVEQRSAGGGGTAVTTDTFPVTLNHPN